MLIRTESKVAQFPGIPDAPVTKTAGLRYGVQPGTTPLLTELAENLQSVIDRCAAHAAAPAAKALLRGYVCDPKLLAVEHKQGDPDTYKRHLLYAAPDGSMSILALVWLPGQVTPIHGHTAWGAVGVYEGEPFCENFATWQNDNAAIGLRSTMKMRLQPGTLASVRPGIDDVHRIGNDTMHRAITLHVYGRDLLAEPGKLNITFSQ
jgi:predicted metal-dependent enzyme (double-stranded beta helix superfamily)